MWRKEMPPLANLETIWNNFDTPRSKFTNVCHNQTDYIFHVSHMPVISVNKGGEHERALQLSVSLFLFLYHNKKCFSRALDTGQSTVISGAP